MYFTLELLVRDMTLSDASIGFRYTHPRSILVTLRRPTAAEKSKYEHDHLITVCTASTEREPSSEAVRTAFEALAVGGLSERLVPEPAGQVTSSYRRLPLPFRSFVEQLTHELHDAATRTVHVLRWRGNVMGRHSPFVSGASKWSFDGQTWHPLPPDLRVSMEVYGSVRFNDEERAEIERLVSTGRSEPLGHALLREAWHQRGNNPRSAIIIGIAAAEVGVKECVVDLVPKAQWLVEKAPAPPLVGMLREYLPLLPVRRRIRDGVPPPPDSILNTLRKGVQLRNRVAHAGASPPGSDTVEEVLEAVRDVLWLLDYYCGFEWALNNLSRQTMMALEL